MVTVIKDSDVEDANEEVKQESIPKPTSKRRAPKTEIDPDRSISVAHLPNNIKSNWVAYVVPTLIDYAGTSLTPWQFEKDSDTFVALIQIIIDIVHPEEHYTVVKGSKAFNVVCVHPFDFNH